jgi:hypothetical protein
MNATQTRFKTLDLACQEIERLEQRVVALNAELAASKSKAQTPTPPSAPAGVSQTPAAATPPVFERPLASLSKREIVDMMDEANARGDKAETDKLWREYSARK